MLNNFYLRTMVSKYFVLELKVFLCTLLSTGIKRNKSNNPYETYLFVQFSIDDLAIFK